DSWTYPVVRDGKTLKEKTSVRDHYRVMWRAMTNRTAVRTLISALVPPGAASVHTVFSAGLPGSSPSRVVSLAATMSSLLADFLVRETSASNIFVSTIERLPSIPTDYPLFRAAALRTLRLNSLTADAWTGGLDRPSRPARGDVGPEWSMASPLRIDEDRRQALVEIDAIMAIVTGISIDDLVTIYRTQFGVLNDYDRGEGKKAYIFDANGRQIPSSVRTAWNKAGRPETGLPVEDRTAVHPSAAGTGRTIVYEQPFRILDREADMRRAYAEFQRRMEETS